MAKISLDSRKLKQLLIKGITKSSVLSNIEELNNMHAHAGITGEFALIMGVNNFGDPFHGVPNYSNAERKTLKKRSKQVEVEKLAEFHPIPARPFLTDAQSLGRKNIQKYINDNIAYLGTGVRTGRTSQRSLSAKDFMQGLAETMAENIRENWRDSEMYAPNAPMTIHNKPAGSKPLHGKSFSEKDIKGWIDG